jgi:endoglucanase
MLDNIANNSDVWIGWTYWSSGAWQSNYMFNIPTQISAAQKTQLDVLRPFLTCTSATCRPTPPTLKAVQQIGK